jgi:CelD/BcsL family acetyltransferase involved in cellulose biosynthesis
VTEAADGPTALVEAIDRRDLPRFEAAWRDLAARAGQPNAFAEPEFLIPALQRLAHARVRVLLVWRDADRAALTGLAAIAPPRLPIGLASLWRSEQAALPAILLDRDAATEALAAIVDALRADAPRLVGLRLPFSTADGPVVAAAAALAARRALSLKAAHARRRAALVVGARANFEARLEKRRRKEWARQRRRLEELGRLDSRVGADTAAIEGFLAVENSGWKGARRSALDAHAERAAFARETLARFAARGALEIHTLALKDELIAAAAVLRAGNRAFYWKTAYDERFAAYSPGVQATLDLSRRLERDPGLTLVDSCAVADHPMIDRAWRDRIELVDLALSLTPGGGAVFALAAAAAHGIERLKRRARRLADATVRLSRF